MLCNNYLNTKHLSFLYSGSTLNRKLIKIDLSFHKYRLPFDFTRPRRDKEFFFTPYPMVNSMSGLTTSAQLSTTFTTSVHHSRSYTFSSGILVIQVKFPRYHLDSVLTKKSILRPIYSNICNSYVPTN